ncbi:hypothetical protein DH2020_002188 [Rehmannia glutinosa]|uniref:AT-hook motif nuclear-localized protein n=1 Tax=Rehmannia glutinosa TaxID=99300 RepID=A0ABR0XT37_REHGL
MDQRESMAFTGSASYYVHQGTAESVTGLQNSPSMSPLSNAVHFQSNTGGGLNVPPLPLDTSSAMSGHGVGVGPPAMQQGEPVRRKRGRPRKYGHDSAVSLALSPSMSNAASIIRPTQKWRGRPPGTGRKNQLSSPGGSSFGGSGTMIPHIINVTVGEGHFDMVNLSGSYINDVDGPHGPTGGLNVTFAGPDGRLIGGPVEGVLIAASPVQVIAGSMQGFTSKPKNKVVEDRETSGDPDRTLGNSVTPANMQPSQNLSPMGGWPNSR